ncbi:hypothetical protein E3P86_01725 [Wallemia ichthyophaga]|uniref:Uncharacterized protein n=1 Tax=Wallemia ichthyophaga TaxID=245174 RepID=A0A4V4M5R2_WALIC|nr:hypothetical protein E3P86_01725 [Wallemia ichthyophaga]
MIAVDVVVHNVLNELSMDGNWGSDIRTLKKYIKAQLNPSLDIEKGPLLEFFWKMLAQQSSFQVGLATQQLKLALRGKAPPRPSKGAEQTALFEVLNQQCSESSLGILLETYGDNLRVRTDDDMNWFAITGLNHRPPKLSPMVVTVLTFISRSKENGITFIEMTKMTGFDSKSIFYCVKILLEMDLVVKMHTIYQGATTNVAIHRKFLANSRHYQAQAQTESTSQTKDDSDREMDVCDEEGEQIRGSDGLPQFSPLNEAHLNNAPLLRSRILKLIRNCPNRIIHHKFIFVKIGFPAGNKFIRRVVGRHLGRMIDEGYLERCSIKASTRSMRLNCLRIPDEDETFSHPQNIMNEDLSGMSPGDDEEDDDDDDSTDTFGITLAITIEKQVMNIVHESGISGITMTAIKNTLPMINRRTLESILLRHETDHDPGNLSDLALKSITESCGRERRQVYFSRSNFVQRAEREGLDVGDDLVSEDAGLLSSLATDSGCASRQDYQALIAKLIGATGKKKNNRQGLIFGATPDQSPAPKKLGRPRKTDPPADTGTVKKRGRPRKTEITASFANATPRSISGQPEETETPSKASKKRTHKDEVAESLPQKKKGRPSKKMIAEAEAASAMNKEQSSAKEAPTQKSAPDQFNESAQNGTNSTEIEINSDTDQVSSTNIKPDARSLEETHKKTSPPDEKGSSDENNKRISDTPSKRKLRSRGSIKIPSSAPIIIDEDSERESSKRKKIGSPELDSDESAAYQPEHNEDENDQKDESYETEKHQLGAHEDVDNVGGVEGTNEINITRNVAESGQPNISVNDAEQINELDTKENPHEFDTGNAEPELGPTTPAAVASAPRVRKTKHAIKKMRSERTDLSHHRRLQDLFGAIKGNGGIVEASRESYDVYQKYVHGPKYQTAPLIDKAAMNKTLNVLFQEGKLKQTIVSSRTYGQGAIQKKLIYLSDLDPQSHVFRDKKAQIGKDMMQMYQPRSAKKEIVSDNIGYISLKNKRGNLKLPEDCHDPSQREEVRKTILSDVKAVARLHGYISGKFTKAHKLYLLLTSEMQHKNELTHCISEEEPIISLNYFRTDIPLEQHMQLFPWTKVDAMALEYKYDNSKSKLRVKDLPHHLQKMVGEAFSKRYHFVIDCIRILWHLNLVELMEEVDEITTEKTPHANNLKGVKELRVPQKLEFFKLRKNGLFLSFEDKPVLRDGMTLNTAEDVNKYFERLKTLALNSQDASKTTKTNENQTQDISNFLSFAAMMQRRSAWQETGLLSVLQRRYLTHLLDEKHDELATATQEIFDEIAYTCAAPTELVKDYIAEESSKREKLESKKIIDTKKKRSKSSKKLRKSNKYSKSVDAKVQRARSRHMDQEGENEDKVVAEQVRQLKMRTEKKRKPKPKRQNEYRFDPPLEQPPGKAIDDIIEDHKRLFPEGYSARQTRHYDYWNADTEELLRDTIAVIKSHTKKYKNPTLTAAIRVFPRFKTGQLRNHEKVILEDRQEQIYVERLAQEYENLCKDFIKDTKMDKASSIDNIDLVEHLNLIRTHIDKRALWINTTSTSNATEVLSVPDSLEGFFDQFDVTEEPTQSYSSLQAILFDPAQTEVARERAYSKMNATDQLEVDTGKAVNTVEELNVKLAEVAIKMSTHDREVGHSERSQKLLENFSEDTFFTALENIKAENILCIPVKQDGPTPLYAFTDSYKHDSHGPWQAAFMQSLFDSTVAVQEGKFSIWPVVVQEPLQAALLNCISSHKLECSINIDNFSARFDSLGSRAVQDDDYENIISITSKGNKAIQLPPLPNHIYTHPMEVDECRQIPILEHCGPVGLSKDQVPNNMEIDAILGSASAIVAGYDTDRLVKSKFGENWCVKINDKYVYPRQWVKLEGNAVESTWRSVLFALISTLMIYPGISLTQLRKCFSKAYDRLEVVDAIQALLREGLVHGRMHNAEGAPKLQSLADESELCYYQSFI